MDDLGGMPPMPMDGQPDMAPMMAPEMVPYQYEIPEHIQRLQQRIGNLVRMAQMPNAAEALDESELGKIGGKVVREYQIDKTSRADWEDKAKRAMDIARQVKEAKNTPWANASNVKYPLLTTAALQFGARAYPALVDGPRIVKCQVMGADQNGQKAAAADRVSQHMSFQLLFETEWEADTDTMVHQLPVIGCAFKKVYQDGFAKAGFCSDLVSAFDFVVNQNAKSLETVPRATHVIQLYPHEIAERQRAGTMLDVDLKGENEGSGDDDAPHTLLEQHRYLDLDDDGVPEPWIVTVHERTEKVLRIKPCFDPAELERNVDFDKGVIVRIPRKEYFVKIPFIPDPKGGFYDVGFGHLLGDINDEIDTSINQMNDAATMQNAGGGFIGGGIDLGKGKSEIAIAPGQYKTVRASGNDLKNNIVPFAHPGPSKTTLDLLTLMIEAGKDISGVQDIMVGDMPANQTATGVMATIEQGMKVFTAIYKRIFRGLKKEFKLIFEINRVALNQPRYVALLDQPVQVTQADYQGELDLMPVADPNNITDMQRMAKAQLVLEEGKNGNPHVNIFEATKRAFEAARIERVEELLVPPPPPDQPPPPSPEEQAAKVKVDEMQATAQIKQQGAQLALEAKMAALQMDLQKKQADLELAEKQMALKAQQQMQDAALREAELERRWRELEVKEAEAKLKAEAANEPADAD